MHVWNEYLIINFHYLVAKYFGWALNESAIGSITRGLVGDVDFALLPPVKANHTFILTLAFQVVNN